MNDQELIAELERRGLDGAARLIQNGNAAPDPAPDADAKPEGLHDLFERGLLERQAEQQDAAA